MRKNIYAQALEVQNASNISGIARSLEEEILPAAREESNGEATDHPAVRLFAYQLDFLSNQPGHADWANTYGIDVPESLEEWNRLVDICEERSDQ